MPDNEPEAVAELDVDEEEDTVGVRVAEVVPECDSDGDSDGDSVRE